MAWFSVSASSPGGAARPRWRLAYHLAAVLAVKCVLLALLWHAFIGPYRVSVDVDAMGRHIVSAPPSPISPSSGDNK
jgi:hypothetical protein